MASVSFLGGRTGRGRQNRDRERESQPPTRPSPRFAHQPQGMFGVTCLGGLRHKNITPIDISVVRDDDDDNDDDDKDDEFLDPFQHLPSRQ